MTLLLTRSTQIDFRIISNLGLLGPHERVLLQLRAVRARLRLLGVNYTNLCNGCSKKLNHFTIELTFQGIKRTIFLERSLKSVKLAADHVLDIESSHSSRLAQNL